MSLPDAHVILNGVLILAAVVVGFTLLKAALRFTARISLLGCGALAVLAAVVFVVSRLR